MLKSIFDNKDHQIWHFSYDKITWTLFNVRRTYNEKNISQQASTRHIDSAKIYMQDHMHNQGYKLTVDKTRL